MKSHATLLIAALFLAACSKPSAPPRQFDLLKLSYKNVGQPTQRQIPIAFLQLNATSAGRTDESGQTVSYSVYSLCLANYDIFSESEKPNPDVTKGLPPEADTFPTRVCLTVNGKEGSVGMSAIPPGVYAIAGNRFTLNSLSSAGIFWDKGSKLGNSAVFNMSEATGYLTIQSASEDLVSGEIELRDNDSSVNGTFSLKPKMNKARVPPMN